MEQKGSDQPSAREIFEGKGAVLGKELVEKLVAEEIGVGIYYTPTENKTTRFMIDREPGEEDFMVRQKETRERHLLGIAFPVAGTEDEYAFIGITEGSFIFQAIGHYKDSAKIEFNPLTSKGFSFNWSRFIDYVSYAGVRTNDGYKVSLHEHQNPESFVKIVMESVEAKRKELESIKSKREDVRNQLLKGLFGGG